MKKYRVIGRNRDALLKKVAEKLNVDLSLIGFEIKSEEVNEDGNKVITLDVWIKENSEVLKEISKEVIKEPVEELIPKAIMSTKKKTIEDIIKISIDKTGVYLQIEEKTNFNTVVDFIMEKEIKDPIFDNINNAFKNIGTKEKIAEYFEGIYEESKIDIEVSDDRMKAYVMITKPRGNNKPTVEDVVKKAEERGIKVGIKKDVIEEIIKNKNYEQKVLFVEGVNAINGEDGYIDYKIKTAATKKKLKPLVDDGSKVDFKSLDLVENVEKGTLLAVKVMPKIGERGMNIFGEEIAANDGREIEIEQGKNTEISEDGMELIASIDGMINMLGKKIDVLNVFSVQDVGLATGDINFNGSVVVKGDVQAEYNVTAEGNIVINGNVEQSLLTSDGDITIKGGCFGKSEGTIKSKNDVILNFVESTKIEAEGTVIANEAIMNCIVTAGKRIVVMDKKGTIVGGDLKASEGIEAINIGSARAIKTEIEVGVNPKILDNIKKAESDIEETKKKMEQVEKNLNYLQEMKSSAGDKLPEDKEEMLKKITLAKFSMAKTIKELEVTIEEMKKTAGDVKNAVVAVHNICYAGVKIKIRKGIYTVKEPLMNVKFYYDNGEVKFTSLT